MKRLGMILGIGLLLSASPIWAQSVAASAARQQSDEAVAKARAEEAAARARAEEAKQNSANSVFVYNKALGLSNPTVVQTFTQSGGLNLNWNTNRSNDPLAALQVAPGTWWNNSDYVTRLSLTKDQQRKMDEIFQQFRLKLIDLNAALSKEELILDPLIASERLDEMKILTQIDRIAQARAELEKANSRMLLGIRQSLTMEQWSKIQPSPVILRLTSPRK